MIVIGFLLLWCLLAVAIPLVLIAASFFKYRETRDVGEIITRLVLAFLIYVPITFLTLIPLGGAGNAVAHRKILTSAEILFCFALVLIYGCCGWFLWSLVKGSFIKPWLFLSRDYNKPQTLFDEYEK